MKIQNLNNNAFDNYLVIILSRKIDFFIDKIGDLN